MTGVTQARAQTRMALVSGAVLTASMLAWRRTGRGPGRWIRLAECLAAAEPKTYGYIKPGPDTWYQRDVDGFVYAAEADGNEVVVLDTEYDSEKEIANIESLVNQGVDGISMFSSTEAGATAAARGRHEGGHPGRAHRQRGHGHRQRHRPRRLDRLRLVRHGRVLRRVDGRDLSG